MKSVAMLCLAASILGCVGFSQEQPSAPERAPLLLVQEIPLPNVKGRIDHFTFDANRKRVMGAALGNNTVEVVDTFAGRTITSIAGAAAPQGLAYVSELNKLFVANGADGKLRVYDGDTFKLLHTVDIGDDADTGKRLEDAARLDAHPESFQLAISKPVIYANIATKAKIALIDRTTHKVTDWPLKSGKANYPMALDEADHRLFVVTRKPGQVVV